MREKEGKSRNTVFFPMIWGSGGSKSRLAKAAGAEPAGQMRDEKLHAVVARSTIPSQNVQSTSCDNFGSCDVENVHTIVARSTFPSQNVQNTPVSDHFSKLRCWKSERRCGAKHISKSKCTKHTILGPHLTVEMSKKCTPMRRDAHFQVKMYKTHQCRTTFGSCDVEKVHALVARSTFRSQNAQNTTCSRHVWRFRCRFASLHYNTLHYTTLHVTTLHCITFHYASLHYTTLHYNYTTTQLHSTTLHYTNLHYTTLHYTKLHYTTLHYTTLQYTTLHSTTPHNYTTTTTQLHSTTLNDTTLHYITLHYTPLHYSTLHYTPLH